VFRRVAVGAGEVNSESNLLRGARLLIVEDEYLLAREMADYFENIGTEIVGPVGTVAHALALIASSHVHIAVLDVNLRDERVYPVANDLTSKKIPFVFASGYGSELEPDVYAGVPRCIKPIEFAVLAKILGEQINQVADRRSS
jgi:two-component SAPR family response regulator